MKKFISKKVQKYLSQKKLPSYNKKEAAELITDSLLKDTQFKKLVPLNTLADIKDEIRDEVFELLQKKTYGHYSLKEYLASLTKKSK